MRGVATIDEEERRANIVVVVENMMMMYGDSPSTHECDLFFSLYGCSGMKNIK